MQILYLQDLRIHEAKKILFRTLFFELMLISILKKRE